jgi:hypothetical protein
MVEVAIGVAHPPTPGAVWHSKPVLNDYTKVEVHTVNPDYAKHKIEYATSEGIRELRLLTKQFILWYKKDIVLNVSSPTSSDVHFQTIRLEDGEIYSPSREDHLMHEGAPHSPAPTEQGVEPLLDETPHEPHSPQQHSASRAKPEHNETTHVPHSPQQPSAIHAKPVRDEMPHVPPEPQPSAAHADPERDETPHVPPEPHPAADHAEPERDETPHVPPEPHPCPARTEQGHEEMAQSSKQAPQTHEQGHAREGEDVPQCEAQKMIPVMIRSIGSKCFVDMPKSNMYKWYGHDMFKPQNQGPNTFAHRIIVDPSEHKPAWKYTDVEKIKWSKECPKEYTRGKHFLPNRVLCNLPLGIKRFHDWYFLHVARIELDMVEAIVPSKTF